MTFLTTLLNSPGPSGFESTPARLWREEAAKFATEVTADVHGNSYATIGKRRTPEARGTKHDAPSVMFAGHIDEIGLMVVHVDDDGFLTFDGIGGWDSQVFVGQRVTLLGRKGPVAGVIGKKAIHLMDKEDREKVSKIDDLWIDIGAKNKKEAEQRVRVGDAGVISSEVLELPNGRIASRSLDNRIGAYVVLEALRLLSRGPKPAATVTAVATTQEEIGYSGGGARTSATTLEADCAIVVDVTHATDFPTSDKRKKGDFKLGSGPSLSRGSAVNGVVFEMLVAAAEREKIPYTIEAAPRSTSTDADQIFTAHRGIATGLVSVPVRYMHSPNELVQLEDVQRAAKLLAMFARMVGPKTSFIPK